MTRTSDEPDIRRPLGFSASVTLTSPYARFNLRRNPFGELTRQERAELAVVDASEWLRMLQQSTTALQFVGECGQGKTTHLLALHRLLDSAAYVYLPEDGPHPQIPFTRPLLIDEAQRLGRRERRRTFTGGGPLVLGTHEDLHQELASYGFEVSTIDVAACRTPKFLAEVLNARILASRARNADVPQISLSYADRLLRELGTNLRAIEQSLYDDFQHAAQKGFSWPPAR